MFQSCYKKQNLKEECVIDDELKEYMDEFVSMIHNLKISKKEIFKLLVDVEDNYEFKDTDNKKNIKNKKILIQEMEDEIKNVLFTNNKSKSYKMSVYNYT